MNFEELVRTHQDKVFGLCLSFLGGADEAEDAAQEIFIKAFRFLPQFQGGSSFSTWLYRIAVNHCKDLLRKRGKEKAESWEGLMEKHGEKIEALLERRPADGLAPQDSELISRVLAALPEDYREVLILRESQGLSYQEIAETLDCSLDAVKARLKRVRAQLAQNLRHFLGASSV